MYVQCNVNVIVVHISCRIVQQKQKVQLNIRATHLGFFSCISQRRDPEFTMAHNFPEPGTSLSTATTLTHDCRPFPVAAMTVVGASFPVAGTAGRSRKELSQLCLWAGTLLTRPLLQPVCHSHDAVIRGVMV